ncbi:MAG: acetyl-CoA carboxylase, carboxyltransferase subunit beta [Armatimonadetes bacterium]|nr:acetyl-CoA carboxylase, carboxyltransferase subunit beta [Armatimonadota bacterium]NIM24638.1 acetyl-CoA carboxylase, carboxyltransferase subunit beta [Armatimonadota bacterium]NIM68517.1 acetyl-CoA carboxylase, carboxyltransferase subunit beta [Armatimonadota bacterium]NIM76899.1 acetyl-CoA carboxylase, carboxyltransferase subunit beta [Armatimonadota bacterium]NIN06711.1 acetyl-CoA carboxylase, carboxyltransferase subunit beta [Armatimonadota bacterium]
MKGVPDDLWVKCTGCSTMLYSKELEQSLKVCQKCGYHLRLSAEERIRLLVDEGSFQERDTDLTTQDPLSFPSYKKDIARYRKQTGCADSMVWGEATIGERAIILGVSEFGFMGGSMGSVMGEKVVRAAEEAAIKRQPLVLVCSGGGARMHEGIISLMQMARTTAAMARLADAKVPYIAIFADPMLAGIAASFAFIADIIIAEPGAIVGFAGPRVVEQAYRIKLPPGSMTAEFHLAHGMVDMVLARREIRPMLVRLMNILR